MCRLHLIALLFFPIIAFGDCTSHLDAWAKALHPDLKFDSQNAVCKADPGDSKQLLAAMPFAVNVDNNGVGDYGLDVLVADATSGKIIASYQHAAITSDAVQFTGLTLDTARYQLAPGLRAFGVRISHRGASRVNLFHSETLNLYLYSGSQLRQVMSGLAVSTSSGGEWDGSCAGDFNETKRTLAIGKPGKGGFASLRVAEKSTDSRTATKGEDCEEVEVLAKTATYALNYDGSRYPIPNELSAVGP